MKYIINKHNYLGTRLRKLLRSIILICAGLLAGPEQALACPGGSEKLYLIPIHAATGTLGIGFLVLVFVEALLFRKMFQISLRNSFWIMILCNVTALVLNYLFVIGTLVLWFYFQMVAAVVLTVLTSILLYKDGLLEKYQKFSWLIVLIILLISVPALSFISVIGHQLAHRGADAILGTPLEYIYYCGLFVFGILTTIAFEGFIVGKLLGSFKNNYFKLFKINFVSQIIMFAMYMIFVDSLCGH